MTSHLMIPIDIPDVAVLRTEITSENRLMIYVESTLETTTCSICGQEMRCTYGHGQELKLRHLPVFDMETYVVIRPKRGQCKHCWNELYHDAGRDMVSTEESTY
jgi:transposase